MKITKEFSIDTIKQDVLKKPNQCYNRGIIPAFIAHEASQDIIVNKYSRLCFTLKLIEKK
ncbi:MAG: hypothetical protein COB98_04830 [Flavobacteriaceae bacterium]|nr:MAG: hypothetical protein COB98_04830 [Flavobacteriaceae bacterium]